MKLVKQNVTVKCDMPRCRRTANYVITADGTASWCKINICNDCIVELRYELTKVITPPNVENHIKKARYKQDKSLMENE